MLALLVGALLAACAQVPSPPAAADRMAWWRQARFGMFVHWGLYSLPAPEWQGRTDQDAWIRDAAHVPLRQYERLVAKWNPTHFDADAWVRTAKAAGMQYLVFTAKYHDGFCLFDSAQTQFDVMSTPFHQDIVKLLVDACRRQGMRIGLCYSIMDWHHPDYLPRRSWEERSVDDARLPRYFEYLQHQVAELLNHYGPIDIMWFDGDWESTWTHAEGRALFDLCRTLQPQMLINNRVDKSRGGQAGLVAGEEVLGDFSTPQQEVPETALPGVDWETCMPIGSHWGWNPTDTGWKSPATLVRTLVDVASKGGNLLLGIGPMGSGELPKAAVERLDAIGDWMRCNGESIHDTVASPFGQPAFGRCTFRPTAAGGRLYLHVFDWPADGRLSLSGFGNEVQAATLLLAEPQPVPFRHADGELTLQLPASMPDAADTVIAVDLLGQPLYYRAPDIEAAAPIFVRELEVRIAPPPPGLSVRYTLDGSEPTARARTWQRPLRLSDSTTIKARTFRGDTAVATTAVRSFTKVAPQPAVERASFLPGLTCRIYDGRFEQLPDFAALQPRQQIMVGDVSLPTGPSPEREARVYDGFLQAPEDDVYTLALRSDDGSRLFVDGQLLVDNDGLHGALEESAQVALAAGPHQLRVEWFNLADSGEVVLRWARLGEPLRPVPATALVH